MALDRLKIAMLSVHSCPVGKLGSNDTGGMSVYIREAATELGKLGHSVDIYTRAHDPKDNQIVELDNNVRIIHLQVGNVEPVHKLVVYSHLADFACSLESFRRSEGLQYDLIHSHYWLSSWVGRQVQGWWNVPHITMFHTLGAVKNAMCVGADEPDLRIETEKELVKSCHRIVAATETEKKELTSYYDASPDIISVIPCGVNLGLFRPLDKEIARRHLGFNGNSILLYVGRIEPLKGIDRLLMAMASLDLEEKLTLVVVGGDSENRSEVERLQSLSRKLNIQNSVTFTGPVRQEELPHYYSAADICIIPSYYESFGLVALESLACGTSVVAAKVGGIESIVHQDQTGYVVKDNSPVCLADGIAALLSKPDAGALSTDSIRESVRRFSWSNIAEALVEEYRAIIGNHNALVV